MEKTRIKDIFKTSSGCTPTSSNPAFYDHDDYRWLNSSEVAGRIYNTKKHISEKAFKKYTALKVYPKDTVVIAMYGATVGEIGILKVDSTTNQAVCAILPNHEIANPDYFYYKMLSEKQNLIGLASGSARTNISQQIIADYETVIPIMAEQNKVADVLCAIDDLIEVNNKIIETSEKLMREIYDYWFVQFDFPDENGHPYKSSGGEMVYDEKLKREIPKGWRTLELGDIIKEAKKSSVQVNGARERAGAYPFFTSGDEILDFDEYYVDGFNIFLNTGGNADIKSCYGKSAYSTDTWCISADEYSYMLFIFLDSIKQQINNNYFAGSGLKHLQKNAFKKIKIIAPEENLLRTFNDLAQSSYLAISSHKAENKKLASLRDWLLPMLMNGQVKVKDK